MTRHTPEMIARLPKWAQDHIAYLTRDLAEAKAANARHGDLTQTNTTVESVHDALADEYLAPNSTVTFRLANGYRVRVRVTNDGHLSVNADAIVMVRHQASNCFTLEVTR